MINSRLISAKLLPVMIRPLFGVWATAGMARSISPGSIALTGLTSIPSDGAREWTAENWPTPCGVAGSRITATRVCSGLDKFADTDDCRQPRAERKRDDASTVGLNECIAHNVKCVRLERLEGGSNILYSPYF